LHLTQEEHRKEKNRKREKDSGRTENEQHWEFIENQKTNAPSEIEEIIVPYFSKM